MRYSLACVATLGVCACAAPSVAGQATFTRLDMSDSPDVTVDQFGHTQVVLLDVGAVWVYNFTLGGALLYVGDGNGYAISDDGSAIAGTIFFPNQAVRGTLGAGWQPLGGIGTCGGSLSTGYGISGDGSTMVGLAWPSCNSSGFVWTAETGMLELENLGNGTNRATVVSDDGQVVAGFAQGSFSRTPAVWNASDQTGWLFDMNAVGEVNAINSDGSVLAGEYYDDTVEGPYTQPFYWTEPTGVVVIPSLPAYPGGHLFGTSENGGTLVGTSGTIVEGRTAMIWRPEWGSVELTAKVEELGALVPDDFFPQVARGVTRDGRTVVGWGIWIPEDPKVQGGTRAFLATLPPQIDPVCDEDLDGDGQVGFTDLTQLLGAWGPCGACPEDLDADGAVGFTDLTQLLGSWGPCA